MKFVYFFVDEEISESIVTCAPGWTFFPHTEKCYQHVKKNSFVGHDAAEAACESISPVESTGRIIGNLASVPDVLTNTFLNELSENKSVWIGGKRSGPGKNDWIWSDGTAWNFTAWLPGEPANYRGVEFLFWNEFDQTWKKRLKCQLGKWR